MTVSPEEDSLQLELMGELCALFAGALFKQQNERDYFPISQDGPQTALDPQNPATLELCIDIPVDDPTTAAVEASEVLSPTAQGAGAGTAGKTSPKGQKPPSPRGKGGAAAPAAGVEAVPEVVFTHKEYVKYLSAALCLYSHTNKPAAVVANCTKLWNYLVHNWTDPVSFAQDFKDLSQVLFKATVAVTSQLESATGVQDRVMTAATVAITVGGLGETGVAGEMEGGRSVTFEADEAESIEEEDGKDC